MNKIKLTVFIVVALIFATVIGLYYNGTQIKTKDSLYARAEMFQDDDPSARLEYERRMLIDPATGKIPDDIRRKELEFARNLPTVEELNLNKVSSANWSLRGPINRGGRTRALGIDVRTQTAPNITIIAAGVSGGIYKSTDNGVTWVNKLSPSVIHSVTCIAQDVVTGFEDNWYAGTGEARGNSASGGGAFFTGDGVYKSTDNGETWTLLPSTSDGNGQSYDSQWSFVNNITVNNPTGTVFAAASNVIMRSGNGGSTWTTVRSTLATSTMSDVQITSTGIIYAAIPSGVTDAGISRSTDDGNTWTSITPGGFPANYGRIAIAIAPSSENIVYFWVFTGSGATGTELWQYDNSGGSWVNRTANLPAPVAPVGGINVQGSYDMIMKVKPDDANFVVIGGTNLYKTTDGFATAVPAANWMGGYATVNNVSQYANHHPDQHSLVFLKSPNAVVLYSGHDGGVSKTNDVTQTTVVWSDISIGYVTSQFYSLAIDPLTANDKVIAGGLQDNGNYTTFSDNYNTNWIDWGHGGDGAFAEVRKTSSTTYTVYLEAQNGWLWRQKYNTSGTITSDNFIQPTLGAPYAFVNPFVLDVNNSDIMYFAAGVNVIRSTDISTTNTWSMLSNATTGNTVTALSVSQSVANRLYIGTNNSEILKVDGANTGNPSAVNISAGLPTGAYVNCIYVDPANADNIIAVLSNYSVKSLWSSTNGGSSWTDVSGNLEQNPDGSGNGPSCRWVASVSANGTMIYYVATSTGLYSTSLLNGTSTVWAQEGSGTIGNIVCTMVKGRDIDEFVAVATHGGGIYSASNVTSVEDETSQPTDEYVLSQNYPNPFNPRTVISFSIPQAGQVKLSVFDALGKEVKVIAAQEYSAGSHTINFNATGLSSGVYFYRIETGSFVQSKKMILMK